MKVIVKYIWPFCFTFILLVIAKVIYDLVTVKALQFNIAEFIGFFVGAVVIAIFFRKDFVPEKK